MDGNTSGPEGPGNDHRRPPVDVLSAARGALSPDGALLVADEAVARSFTASGDAVERMTYGWSITHCLPAAMAEPDSAAIGTVIREATVRRLAASSGSTPCGHDQAYGVAGEEDLRPGDSPGAVPPFDTVDRAEPYGGSISRTSAARLSTVGLDAEQRGAQEPPRPLDRDAVMAAVRELVAAVPTGCTWLLPVTHPDGTVMDFVIAAVSDRGNDVHGRGTERIGERLGELYPSMVGGSLWALYCRVLDTGTPGEMTDFQYDEQRSGVVAHASFEVRVYRVLGGLLVWWQRMDEARRRLDRTELLGSLGWAEYDLLTGRSDWSPGLFRIFERDPALGPMSRADQAAAILPEDRGVTEAAWQTLDTGAPSDVTVRIRIGRSVKHLRILSDVARDANGTPLKIYAVVQDVTARENSRTAIQRLSDQLRTREMSALAEHRLAAQLQNLIQPLPREPFELAGVQAMVSYLPAESAMQVGGDWYHLEPLPDGRIALAIGDVAGHGLEAANGMAHLRFSLIAWLSIGIRDPGTLLRYMNRLCLQLSLTATAIVALYDPATGILSWSRAGHMPPLLARAGAADDLEGSNQLLLGANASVTYPVAEDHLRRGDLLLLYTDGLVERRSAGTDTMHDHVKRSLAAVSAEPGPHALTRLRGMLWFASPDDDTCTLALRIVR
jgi:serine phosphatase RsbU (regulator of sigma subunit)